MTELFGGERGLTAEERAWETGRRGEKKIDDG